MFETFPFYKLPEALHVFRGKRNNRKRKAKRKREKGKKGVRTGGLDLLLAMDRKLWKGVKSTTYKDFLQKAHKAL